MGEQQDLFENLLPKPTLRHLDRLQVLQRDLPEHLYLGTTSWTYEDWEGLIYPSGCTSQDYIEHYARTFRAVEVDSTWYRIPSERTIDGWLERTPENFRFAAKVPRVISHEKGLVDCEQEMAEFLSVMSRLGDRLGPLLLQFGYVARGRDPHEYEHGTDFIERLGPFLSQLPTREVQLAVEVRNSKWLHSELLDVLKEHQVALALTSYYTMPELDQLCQRLNPVTADFLYVRFLGDRKKMDEYVAALIQQGRKDKHWNELLWDRREQIQSWASQMRKLVGRTQTRPAYVFFNNHYAGYAPGSLGLFARAWQEAN